MNKPIKGAISRFFETDFPDDLREKVRGAEKGDILATDWAFDGRMGRHDYEDVYDPLQIELVKLQAWAKCTGARIVVVFEGRDGAGKGGSIKRLRENLNPRGARVVALSKPTDAERGQWYFQRYVEHLPTAGEIVFFDRSWYNRAVIEPVFGFCDDAEREAFFGQVPGFERTLVDDGIRFIKIWISVSRAEQMRRLLARENDPLKQWKLSPIDIEGLEKWEAYSRAIALMFRRTHDPHTPWAVVRGDDKRRARLAIMQLILSSIDYEGRDDSVATPPHPALVGDPSILPPGNG
ncbi:MAG: polyphosphate kinase 2 [Pseudomonadota bacterium]